MSILPLESLRAFANAELRPSLADPTFDLDAWLDEWLRRPQPALGGRSGGEMLKEPGGLEAMKRVLGAIVSGAYL